MAAYEVDAVTLRQLEEKLHDKICSVCVDRNPDGSCDFRDEGICSLMEKIPQAVQAIVRVNSPSIELYIESIRQNVCEECDLRNPDRTCDPRVTDRCMLDAYLPLVVEVVEEHFGTKEPAVSPSEA